MVTLTIEKELKAASPNLILGVVRADVSVTKHDLTLWNEINRFLKKFHGNHSMDSLYEQSAIAALREAYRVIGKDPSRYRGSAEALARRILQDKGLYQVNTVVDINNLVSLESLHSVGSYDLARITSPVCFRIGKAGETYKGIGKDTINIAELPVFADAAGPFGSPTSDSERAMITGRTEQIMMVIISFTGAAGLSGYLDRVAGLLVRYCQAANIETSIVE